MGIELKAAYCSVARIVLHMETQRSKEDALGRKHKNLVKCMTAACFMRMVDYSWQMTQMTDNANVGDELFIGDS